MVVNALCSLHRRQILGLQCAHHCKYGFLPMRSGGREHRFCGLSIIDLRDSHQIALFVMSTMAEVASTFTDIQRGSWPGHSHFNERRVRLAQFIIPFDYRLSCRELVYALGNFLVFRWCTCCLGRVERVH
jgi:hypothetical protein